MGIEIILIIVFVVFVTFAAILRRYKRCPSDKILVIYGKTGKNNQGSISSARCIHGGASFIWPVFQSYAFLDLTPISIECNLTNALSKQNIRVDVPCRFTVGISTEPDNMTNAAERLLGLPHLVHHFLHVRLHNPGVAQCVAVIVHLLKMGSAEAGIVGFFANIAFHICGSASQDEIHQVLLDGALYKAHGTFVVCIDSIIYRYGVKFFFHGIFS